MKQKQRRNFRNQLATIWHCEMWFANFALRNFALRNSPAKTLFICLTKNVKSYAKFRIAKFAAKFATSFALRNLQCGFRIAKFRIAKFAVEIRIAKFAAHCEQFAKIPTVLPSDFVLRITFSSELRFRHFWYRWKA